MSVPTDRRAESPAGIDPPELKVKRDAERDVHFHYDRGAREAMRRARPEVRRGLFSRLFGSGRRTGRRRGRSLLPVILGVLAIVLALRLLPRDGATGHLAGYDASLRAYVYQEALLASVAVTWKPGAGEEAVEAPEVTVRFSSVEGEAGVVVSEPLGGGTATVRGRLPGTGAGRRVTAEVAIGGKALRLSAPVGEP